MAPEIMARKWLKFADYNGYTWKCDIWSIGMVFVELL